MKISQPFIKFSQFKHDVAFIMRNIERSSFLEAFLNEFRILWSGDAPKGFDKYFKPPKAAPPEESSGETKKSEEKTDVQQKSPPRPSKSDGKPPDWNFGMFGPSPASSKGSGSGGQGRPIGGEQNPDQNKMLLYGAIGFCAFVASLTFFELGYKEISWKDFINKLVRFFLIKQFCIIEKL
jgi:AFG3 family protein